MFPTVIYAYICQSGYDIFQKKWSEKEMSNSIKYIKADSGFTEAELEIIKRLVEDATCRTDYDKICDSEEFANLYKKLNLE